LADAVPASRISSARCWVETCQAERGTLAVCIREAQRSLAQSSKRLIESKIAALGLGHHFKTFNDRIETPGDGVVMFRGMPYDLQVYVAAHETQRERALRHAQNEAAGARRQFAVPQQPDPPADDPKVQKAAAHERDPHAAA
jgi:hypothetical protein